MIFHETQFSGVHLIEIERHADERGFFARTWCRQEFLAQGLQADFVQSSISVNPVAGTVRGLHFQSPPHSETKVVQCVSGAIYDVVVDLRPESATFRKWLGIRLTAESRQMLYIPERVAHGFQTLEKDTEISYLISAYYVPEAARGIRYDDPALGIRWPLPVDRISEKDLGLPGMDQLTDLTSMLA
jgi:dTDP-4-dehydrorhamnose 3,5-epimerase